MREAFNEFRTEVVQSELTNLKELVDGYFVGYCVLVAFVFLFNIVVKTLFDIMNEKVSGCVLEKFLKIKPPSPFFAFSFLLLCNSNSA